ncbi:MAG: hypothetical protein Q8O66_01715 [bacterium]|nr:hypothetical protein [bacterium]
MSENSLLCVRLGVESLEKAWQESRLVIEQDEQNGEIIACGALWHRKNSVELGSLWVDIEHRGNGYMKGIFYQLISRVSAGVRLFLIANNPFVAGLAKEHGMQEADEKDWKLVAMCSRSCEQCDRLSQEERIRCSLSIFKGGRKVFFKN